MRILVRMVLNRKFLEIISRCCVTLSAIGCTWMHHCFCDVLLSDFAICRWFIEFVGFECLSAFVICRRLIELLSSWYVDKSSSSWDLNASVCLWYVDDSLSCWYLDASLILWCLLQGVRGIWMPRCVRDDNCLDYLKSSLVPLIEGLCSWYVDDSLRWWHLDASLIFVMFYSNDRSLLQKSPITRLSWWHLDALLIWWCLINLVMSLPFVGSLKW